MRVLHALQHIIRQSLGLAILADRQNRRHQAAALPHWTNCRVCRIRQMKAFLVKIERPLPKFDPRQMSNLLEWQLPIHPLMPVRAFRFPPSSAIATSARPLNM
jgi:hypothetical protein